MGLLDDAIKEHLELKRRRGADAEEVARLEQEALGPPQRGEFAGAPAPAEGADVPADEPSPRSRPSPRRTRPSTPSPSRARARGRAGSRAGARARARDHADEAWLDEEPDRPTSRWSASDAAPDQPTVEYTPPADPPAEGEDVLEETPDFLQETPEHDRLWFEQKPPRDFDLDR